jgi:hypothetical protein
MVVCDGRSLRLPPSASDQIGDPAPRQLHLAEIAGEDRPSDDAPCPVLPRTMCADVRRASRIRPEPGSSRAMWLAIWSAIRALPSWHQKSGDGPAARQYEEFLAHLNELLILP